jgi:uncharacterized membrane-anchored protein
MQRKPIANKYRKGMMKSTLQARMLQLYLLFIISIIILHTRSKGSERESEIAKSLYNNIKLLNIKHIYFN